MVLFLTELPLEISKSLKIFNTVYIYTGWVLLRTKLKHLLALAILFMVFLTASFISSSIPLPIRNESNDPLASLSLL